MSKISNNAHYFIAGAGLYYGLSWIFSFYPAFIIGLFACQLSNSPADGTPEMTGLIVMLIAYGVIQVLFACEKYVAVGIIYLITLWPFLHQIYWYWVHLDSGIGGSDECFPLPKIDWFPFW